MGHDVKHFAIMVLFICVTAKAHAQQCRDLFEHTPAVAKSQASGLELFAQRYSNVPPATKSAPRPFLQLPDRENVLDQSFWMGPFHSEIQLYYHQRKLSAPKVKVQVKETAFPYRGFVGENLRYQNQDFQIVNVGTKQLSEDWPAIEKEVAQARRLHSSQNIDIEMPTRWGEGRGLLNSWRSQISQRVTEIYRDRKAYLSGQNLFDLRFSDRVHPQSDDYFVLLSGSNQSTSEMKKDDVERRSLTAIRLVRMTLEDPAIPSAVTGSSLRDDSLPFSQRKVFKSTEKVIALFNQLRRAKGLRFAEISRFANLGEDPPAPLMDALIRKVFEAAKPDVDILVISVDRLTRRLFKNKYRFQDLAILDEGGEQLLYLDTRTTDFAATLADLVKGTESISYHSNSERNQDLPAIQPWSPDESFFEENNQRFETEGEKIHRELLKQVREGAFSHLDSPMPSLTNTRVLTKQRAVQIARWILSSEGRSALAPLSLSAEARHTLARNFSIFTTSSFNVFANQGAALPGGKILVYTDDPQPFRDYLKATSQSENSMVRRLADASSIHESGFDQIIVYDSMYKIRDLRTRDEWQKKLLSQLKPKRTLTILEPLTSNQHEKIGDLILNEAVHLMDEGAPLTEFELGYGLFNIAEGLRVSSVKPLTNGTIEQALSGSQLGPLPYGARADSDLGLCVFDIKAP